MFQFGGAWSFIWAAKPTNFSRGDGTAAGYTHDYSQSIWNSLKSWHICPKLSSDILICDCGSLWQMAFSVPLVIAAADEIFAAAT